MPKRTICVQNPADLSTRHGSLVISQGSREVLVPLEDIWVLILESHQARITTAALSMLSSAGVGVMTCGANHMPNGLHLPLGAHSRHAAIVGHQLAMSKPLKKNLWRKIVIQKIENQARVLEYLGKDGHEVHKHAANVLSDDGSGREAVAASAYFKLALPEATRRNGPYAAALDYGYSVIRAGIGRVAVGGGWLVSRGIHHSSDLNAFNLVDDIIEPFRPLVDLLVLSHDMYGDLTADYRKKLASLFEYQMEIDDRVFGVQSAIEAVFDSLKLAVVDNNADLLRLPSISGLHRMRFE